MMNNHPPETLIDPAEAVRLKATGKTWNEIGALLAKRVKRGMPFAGDSVMRAVRRFRKGRKGND